MTKQISSSFLAVASVKTAELKVIGWKSFTVYFKHTQGWLGFCTKRTVMYINTRWQIMTKTGLEKHLCPN